MGLDDAELLNLLNEDAPYGDLTTGGLGIGPQSGSVVFQARRSMRACATEEAARLFELAGASADLRLASGCDAEPGQVLLGAQGSAAALHLAWKTAQTLVECASGIATAAAEMVAVLRDAGFGTPIACTRKNFPGTRRVAAKAIVSGGASMHRLGLSETLLVFPEHLVFVAEPQREAAVQHLRNRFPEKKLVGEATTLPEALDLARWGADVLQLERFAPADVAICRSEVDKLKPGVLLAAAGGVTAANAIAYARAGSDILVTSAPYSARPADVKVAFAPAV